MEIIKGSHRMRKEEWNMNTRRELKREKVLLLVMSD